MSESMNTLQGIKVTLNHEKIYSHALWKVLNEMEKSEEEKKV